MPVSIELNAARTSLCTGLGPSASICATTAAAVSAFQTDYLLMVDGKTGKRYYRDSKAECEEQAQEILDIEAGRRPAPEPVEKLVKKHPKYEGLWKNGREIDTATGLPKPLPEELF